MNFSRIWLVLALCSLCAGAAAPEPATVYAWFQADVGILTNANGVVTNWQNQAASGAPANRSLNRFGGAPRLVSVATAGGPKPFLRFSGGDNIYGVPAAFGTLANARTIAAYLRLNSTQDGFLFDGSSNVGMTRAQVRAGQWEAGIQPPPLANGANSDPVTLPAAAGQWQLHCFSFEWLGTKTRVTHTLSSGASVTYTNSNTNALAGFILGENVSQSFGAAVDIAEVLVYDRVPAATERQDLAAYLEAKWADLAADTNAPPPPSWVSVFTNGRDGYACYRIPALVTTARGTVLAVADGRLSNCDDIPNPIDLVARRSLDNGLTWGPLQIIAAYGSDTSAADVDTYPHFGITNALQRVAAGDASLLLDRTNGRVWVLYDNGAPAAGQPNNRVIKLEMRYSDDDGATWSPRVDLEAANPGLRPADGQFLTGPGNGVQLAAGPKSGRLGFPVYLYGGANYASVIYSDDHGQTWRLGGNAGTGGGEIQVAETAGGGLLASIRNNGLPAGVRYFNRSADGGQTWGTPYASAPSQPALPDPTCQGSILRLSTTNESNASRLVFANAASASARVNLTLRLSYDEGQTWPVSNQVYAGNSAYSALAPLATGEIGLLFEQDNYSRLEFVRRSVSEVSNGADSLPAYAVWAGAHFTPAQLSDPAGSAPGADPDRDGASNYAEFMAGTDPLRADSALKLSFSGGGTNPPRLAWPAVANKGYTLQSTSNLSTGPWERYLEVPSRPTNSAVELPVNPTNAARFFRLTTPPAP